MTNQNMLQIYDSGSITATTTTDTKNTDRITGYIVKVEIIASASTNFKLWADSSDDNTSAIVDQYILGGAAATVTVNTTGVYYPVEPQVIAAGTVADPDQYNQFFVDDVLEISASAIAADDTYRVKIYYIPYENITN